MQRHTVVAEIFGYLVCLLAVAIFFVSIAGIVNGAFSVVNPAARPHIVLRTGMMFRGHHPGNALFWKGRAGGPVPIAGPNAMPAPPPGANVIAMQHLATGNARYNAARRLVLAIVMLIASIFVFRRTFDWVNRPSTP